MQVLHSQETDTWINVHDLLYFLEITDSTVTFLWASEETGFRHLYLITSSLSGTVAVNGCKDNAMQIDNLEGISATPLLPKLVNKVRLNVFYNFLSLISLFIVLQVAITSGDWEVLGRNIWVDKAQQLVYFLGLRETPLEKHLYVVSLQRPEHVRLLTEPGYSYQIEFDEVIFDLISQ